MIRGDTTARASWQLKLADRYVRSIVRREHWGEPERLAKRARSIFGSPRIWSFLRSRGVDITRVDEGDVQGEWIEPHDPRPGTIVYVHGGGYVACSARTHRPLTSALARLTGRRVFSVDYRLAPENQFPAAFDDTLAAYLWILDQLDGDTSQLVVGGDSAGGGLALALLVAARDNLIPLPACAFLFSPWTDLAGAPEIDHANAERCAMFAPSNFDEFARAYLGDASPVDMRASPLSADLSGLPPILLQVGERELLLEDSTQVHDRIIASGGRSDLHVWPHVFHGWQMMDGLLPEARSALEDTAKFIQAYLTVNAGAKPRTRGNIPTSKHQHPEVE